MDARAVLLVALWLLGGCSLPSSPGAGAGAANRQTAATPPQLPPVQCPPSAFWNGEVCVWQYVITNVVCPQGASWDGHHCVAHEVRCPAGAQWRGDHCAAVEMSDAATADGQPTEIEPAESAAKREDIFQDRSGRGGEPGKDPKDEPGGNREDIFKDRGTDLRPPQQTPGRTRGDIFDDR